MVAGDHDRDLAPDLTLRVARRQLAEVPPVHRLELLRQLQAHRRAPVAGNETFAHLFSSTRFLGQPALRHERRIQRNRALLLLAGVFLLGYIIFKIVFR